ncbi:MAG TPA: glycoside hydrolase family 2 TIM barrel-domain containing protein [Opitutaceae bacterium]|nr:glycoside hydrolase family 2 TIM barrel-domain containing protein [Opitutaceae bacterium]
MQHTIRSVVSLNGLWDFAFLGAIDLSGFQPAAAAGLGTEKMPVPSAFDALPAYAGRRGAAVYRRRIAVPAGRAARITFGAVSMWCRVFVDGTARFENACGYAPFVVEVPPSEQPERELLVLVDNRFDFERVPMHEEYFDFYQYGGILRDVSLHVLPKEGLFIEHVQVSPTEAYREGGVGVRVELGGRVPPSVSLVLQFDEEEPFTREVALIDGARVELALSVPRPRVWSPETPALHTLRVALQKSGEARSEPMEADDRRERSGTMFSGEATGEPTEINDAKVRFGLRRIEARAGALWLNGERLQLRGYNRHEWHPNFGPCTPELQMIADLQLLRDLGCNFVRGSHYPQNQRFLDLCDEFGFLVWEENLGWGQRERTFASRKFAQDHETALRAMVRASCNHPSVIIWGFLNEAASDADYVRPLFERSVATLRALDPTRLISYASMFALTDRSFDLVDLVALNLYPGWYGCEGVDAPLELIAPHLQKCLEHLDAAGFGEKPVMVSEIGAEGLYGWHDAHNDFFTEEYQAAYLERACRVVLKNPRWSGIALWHFSDVRTYGGGWSLKRPRTFNNKGTLDEYRRPKLAYRAVQAVFRDVAKAAPTPKS